MLSGDKDTAGNTGAFEQLIVLPCYSTAPLQSSDAHKQNNEVHNASRNGNTHDDDKQTQTLGPDDENGVWGRRRKKKNRRWPTAND